jgi:surfactin synthase thioesterase subunit
MKKIVVTLLLFMSFIGYSQTNGITYQAVIVNPSGEQLPGVNNTNAPFANKNICLKFSIVDNNSQLEYIETVQTTTDEFGMVNLIIGTGVQIGGYASSFSDILWNANPKNLKVDLSITGVCSNYSEISNQPFTAVPFALFALNSESTEALAALQATVISNATATTAALGLKENAINKSTTTTLGTSNVLFPTQNAVKTYVDSNITAVNTSTATLQATVNANATAATNAIAVVQADVDANETASNTSDAALQTNIDALSSTVTSNNTTSNTAIAVVQADVDANETVSNTSDTTLQTNINTLSSTVTLNNTASNTAIAVVQADVDANETASNISDAALQTNIDALSSTVTSNNAASSTAIAVIQADIDANETASNISDAALQTNIDALSSTVVSNNTASNTAIAAVQADVDANETASNTSDAALQTNIDALSSTVVSNNTASNTAIAAVQADVDANETASNTSDAALQTNIDALSSTVVSNNTAATNAIALKEDAANKSTDVTLSDATDTKFPTELAVKTYIDNQVTNGIATNVSGIVAIVNGGTGSATQNFVDLTNNQNIAGNKTFGSDIIVNGLKIGNGGGSQSTVIGDSANASQANNTALGFMTLDGNSGTDNTVVGTNSMRNSGATSRNTSIGENSGAAVNTGNENTYLGYNANVTNNSSISNATAIGAGALVTSSNTIQLGNENVTNVNTKGSITANAEISSEITTNLTINNANAEQYKAKVIICNPSSQITITFANDLPIGFNCMVLQKSLDANKINLAAGAGVTLKNRNNYTATAGNYAIATIVNIGGGIIVTAGDMQ